MCDGDAVDGGHGGGTGPARDDGAGRCGVEQRARLGHADRDELGGVPRHAQLGDRLGKAFNRPEKECLEKRNKSVGDAHLNGVPSASSATSLHTVL